MTDTPDWHAPDAPRDPGAPQDQPTMPPAPPPPPNADAKPGVIPLRPLGVGEILDGSISAMRRNPAVMLGVAAVVMAITLVISAVFQWLLYDRMNDVIGRGQNGAAVSEADVMAVLSSSIVLALVTVVVTVLARVFLTGFLTSAVGKAVVGKPAGFREVFADVRPRLLRLLGLTMVIVLVAMVWAVLVVLVALNSRGGGVVLMLLSIPLVIYVLIKISLATPALVLEHGKVFGSLGRSAQLVRGSWWRVFGIQLLAWLIAAVITLIVSLPFEYLAGGFESGFGDPMAPQYVPVTMTYVLLTSIGALIASTFVEPFVAGVTALLYIDRRMRTEGLDIELAQQAGVTPAQ